MWYVKGYLIPTLNAQGIEPMIWNDSRRHGNMTSCIESFQSIGKRSGGTWHLQDDVIISENFREMTEANDDGIVCGFVNERCGVNAAATGKAPVCFLWYSFPCIRIPNEIAREFVEWWTTDARYRPEWYPRVAANKFDDWFFWQFLQEKHGSEWVKHLVPNVVDHVDYLLGGSTINGNRPNKIGAAYFEDHGEEEKLKWWLEHRKAR